MNGHHGSLSPLRTETTVSYKMNISTDNLLV